MRVKLAECPMCKGKGRVRVSPAMRFLQVRHEAGLTQAEMAKKMNVSRTQWTNLEAGRCNPSFELMLRIADFSKCSIDWLMGRA